MPLATLPQAVIFDWDNTLADGWGSIRAAMNAAREAFGQTPLWTLEETKKNCTRALRESFPEWFGADWERARDIFYDVIHRTHISELRALDGADDLIRFLAGKGIPLFIVSTKRGDILRAEIEHLGWTAFFGGVVGASDAVKDKPAREAVEKALEGSGCDPTRMEIWYVGDKDIDATCARNADCRPILIAPAEEAAKCGVENAFSDCQTFLRQIMTCATHKA